MVVGMTTESNLRESNLQADQSRVSVISPGCIPSTSVTHCHKPKHQMGAMVQRLNCHLHKEHLANES